MNYNEFVESMKDKIIDKIEWKELATFVPNKKLPVYNWFYYKEGFSRDLVKNLIEMFTIQKGETVLDPFCGAGTTLLACKESGINAIGYDVMPISVFASRVKTLDHDIDNIKKNAKFLLSRKFVRLEAKFPPIVRRAFNKYALQDISFVRSYIMDLDIESREFFVLALINAAMKCSYAYKDGAVIKFRHKPDIPLRKMLQHVVRRMIKDLEKMEKSSATIVAEINDARRLPLEDESVNAIITSPPYLNNIDYTKVYAIEDFFIHGEQLPGVRAFVGLNEKDSNFLEEINMPLQARLYFEDMNEALKEIHRVLKKGGKAAIVVGNGYVNEIIDSDLILSYIAHGMGFSVKNIYVLNTRFALEDRTIKKGILRESMIILEK